MEATVGAMFKPANPQTSLRVNEAESPEEVGQTWQAESSLKTTHSPSYFYQSPQCDESEQEEHTE